MKLCALHITYKSYCNNKIFGVEVTPAIPSITRLPVTPVTIGGAKFKQEPFIKENGY